MEQSLLTSAATDSRIRTGGVRARNLRGQEIEQLTNNQLVFGTLRRFARTRDSIEFLGCCLFDVGCWMFFIGSCSCFGSLWNQPHADEARLERLPLFLRAVLTQQVGQILQPWWESLWSLTQ